MFNRLEKAPPDPILGLQEAFDRDPNPAKINLSVGVYKDDHGNTPIFRSVKHAEAQILEQEESKEYLGIPGSSEYARAVQGLVLGPGHEAIASGRAVTAQAPGGTGGLRVAGDLIKRVYPQARVWVSEPTWPNHLNVFRAAGLAAERYPYYDAATHGLDLERMLAALREIPEGDIVLLHGCCHNPTGVDPTPEEWTQIGDVLAEQGLLPLVDLAYQGLGDGLREDAAGTLSLCRPGQELLVVNSFSKNFGLYMERVGALTIVAASSQAAEAALSHTKQCIRANYSNPPAHGAAIVTMVLEDSALRAEWEGEVKRMRDRIHRMRCLFVETLAAMGVQRDFRFVERQRGMFSYSGLTRDQVQALRERHSVYALDSGRINVAGMTEANMGALCRAIADVLETA
jgi:aspartate aminotransferase